MDNPGPYLCCGLFTLPLIMGALMGAWWQRRLLRLGSWKKALIPDRLRQKLEDL